MEQANTTVAQNNVVTAGMRGAVIGGVVGTSIGAAVGGVIGFVYKHKGKIAVAAAAAAAYHYRNEITGFITDHVGTNTSGQEMLF